MNSERQRFCGICQEGRKIYCTAIGKSPGRTEHQNGGATSNPVAESIEECAIRLRVLSNEIKK